MIDGFLNPNNGGMKEILLKQKEGKTVTPTSKKLLNSTNYLNNSNFNNMEVEIRKSKLNLKSRMIDENESEFIKQQQPLNFRLEYSEILHLDNNKKNKNKILNNLQQESEDLINEQMQRKTEKEFFLKQQNILENSIQLNSQANLSTRGKTCQNSDEDETCCNTEKKARGRPKKNLNGSDPKQENQTSLHRQYIIQKNKLKKTTDPKQQQ
ncbi:hypothetical protein TTHERM_01567130 (macronuclear) [Tetrahymena thermophila SB210]|uniref:Uncharacterized protein n=1 Tax=Tetrahymena thermophila (strain SB210) TaxID=312017 RepID=Q231K0_TETTS|nr:hypothetical protein TTHERM_01567130 [Tetrahymena thermophila SB210]EAR91207.2 hypothetical protein TTHERM_01567130 [Tetrahymena thermophila SB210]|eukprot:XP_001011452.2 hypothetical protein TTHERM_01567130 [Tetrahymena thermophila SB210]